MNAPGQLVLSKREELFLERVTEIHMAEPGGNDMAFMHSTMCQVGLPRSKVDGTVFERKCGNSSLLLTAGSLYDGKKWVQQPLPYGAMPRLILAYLNTYAVQNNTPEIPVGNSKSDFLRLLGKAATGGKKGSIATFNKQIQALAACNISLGFSSNGHAYTFDGKPVKRFDAWIHHNEGQLGLWPATITFTTDYFETLREHAVPQDLRAIMSLSHSALALDIYFMLAERLHRITGGGFLLHWSNLFMQYGQEYIGKNAAKDFKRAYSNALETALHAYPKAKVKKVPGGIRLMKSPPPIPYKQQCA